MNNFENIFFRQIIEITNNFDEENISKFVKHLKNFKDISGRLFFCGSGGGAGHASHAAADFRKLLNIESYSITDNVSELTARINDDGWDNSYKDYLASSRFNQNDGLFIFSVGGGSLNPPVSTQLINAANYAKKKKGTVFSIVGRDGGEIKKISDKCIVIPVVDEKYVTAHTEGFQAYLWHFLVSHPELNPEIPKWESVV